MPSLNNIKSAKQFACSLWSSGWIVPVGFYFWLIWVCADDWNHDPNYSYGWLIPPLFWYFLWRRAELLPSTALGARSADGVWLFAWVPAFVCFVEVVRLAPFFWRPIPWAIYFVGAVISLQLARRSLGRDGFLLFGVPLIFLGLAIPWPTFIELFIVREFSFFLASVVGEVLLLLGIFAQVQGKVIELTQGSVGVDEACSGLRSLQASLMIGVAVGEWFWLSWLRRVGLVAICVGLAAVVNFLRTLTLSFLVVEGGAEAMQRWHDTVGTVAMVVLALAGAGIGLALAPKEWQRTQGRDWREVLRVMGRGSCSWAVWSASVVMAFFLAHGWYFWRGLEDSRTAAFLEFSSQESRLSLTPPPPEVASILRADAGGYLLPVGELQGRFLAYHFFWQPSRSNGKVFFHRPDVCMPGGGWVQQGNARLLQGLLNDRPVVVHHFVFSRGRLVSDLFWACWADEQPVRFAGSPFSNLQTSMLPEFVKLGRRVFAVELFGLMVPRIAGAAPDVAGALQKSTGLRFEFQEASP